MQGIGRELERFAYRPGWGSILWPGAFFTACGIVLTHKARTESGALPWLLVVASWTFVGLAALMAAWRVVSSQHVVIAERGLLVPRGRFSRAVQLLELDAIDSVERRELSGQVFLVINHAGQNFTIVRSNLPTKADFEAIQAFLTSGIWTGEHQEAEAVRPAASVPFWFRSAVKLTALLTFCGGPLYVTDELVPHLGDLWAYIAGFAPVAVLILVTLTVVEDQQDEPAQGWIWTGAAALLVILLESAFAAFRILTGESRADAGLILFGCAASVVTAILYYRTTRSARAHATLY